jgi:Uma2 family endonuclease
MKSKRLVSLESFLRRYPNREDGFKYEWHKGIIEKTPRIINRNKFIIQAQILAYFYSNPQFKQLGAFIFELGMYIPSADRTRRADMAFLTRQQMADSTKGDLSVAPFVIEVISGNDKINDAETKLNEYFENGVQVVWQIIPVTQTVKVYTSVKGVMICQGDDICSAAPVLENFEMTVNQVLGK